MANKTVNTITPENEVFSTKDSLLLETATATIKKLQEEATQLQDRAVGIAQQIGGQLYIVDRHSLYTLDKCKSTSDWASKRFNIAKSTCSEALNVYRRFGNPDKIGEISANYSAYKFTALIAMKGLSDSEIESYGINPSMPKDEIKDIIKQRKAINDAKAEKEKVATSMKEKVDILKNAGMPLEDIQKVVSEAVPDFLNKEREKTLDEFKTAENALKEKMMEIFPTDPKASEGDSSTDEQPSADEPKQPMQVAYHLEAFKRENGTYDKKAFLAAVWASCQDLMNESIASITILLNH